MANDIFALVGLPQGVRVKQIACGEQHSVCVSVGQELWAWGRGDSSQLGVGTWGHKAIHQPFRVARHVSSVQCGRQSTTYCSGNNILYRCSSRAPLQCLRVCQGLLPDLYVSIVVTLQGLNSLAHYTISRNTSDSLAGSFSPKQALRTNETGGSHLEWAPYSDDRGAIHTEC